MKSAQVLRFDKKRTGLTLIELLVALSLLALIFGWGLLSSIGFYRRVTLQGERDNILSLLRRARAKAVDNIAESHHGLSVGSATYTLFRGDSYAARAASYDENFPRSGAVALSGLSEVVFQALSGDSTVSGTITISDGITNFTITLNSEGRINW